MNSVTIQFMGVNEGHYLQKSPNFTMAMHQSNWQGGAPQHCPVGMPGAGEFPPSGTWAQRGQRDAHSPGGRRDCYSPSPVPDCGCQKPLETTGGKNSFETRKNFEDDVNFYFPNF